MTWPPLAWGLGPPLGAPGHNHMRRPTRYALAGHQGRPAMAKDRTWSLQSRPGALCQCKHAASVCFRATGADSVQLELCAWHLQGRCLIHGVGFVRLGSNERCDTTNKEEEASEHFANHAKARVLGFRHVARKAGIWEHTHVVVVHAFARA